jgi:hypothetical protein
MSLKDMRLNLPLPLHNIVSPPSTKINLASSIRQYPQSTFRIGQGTASPRSLQGLIFGISKMEFIFHYLRGALLGIPLARIT